MLKSLIIGVFFVTIVVSFPFSLFNDDDDVMDNMVRGIRTIIEENIEPQNESSVAKFVENESKDGQLNTTKVVKRATEFWKFPNKTFKKVDVTGTQRLLRREESLIGCVDDSDCNSTFYCNKLQYQCRSCHVEKLHCSRDQHCCQGYECDVTESTCKKRKGKEGDACDDLADCNVDHCCIMGENGEGKCSPYLHEGESCGNMDPFASLSGSFMRAAAGGLPDSCKCKPGLKCAKVNSFFFFESQMCVQPKKKEKQLKKKVQHKEHQYHDESSTDNEQQLIEIAKQGEGASEFTNHHPPSLMFPFEDAEELETRNGEETRDISNVLSDLMQGLVDVLGDENE